MKVLREVASRGSFSAAAGALYLSQSAVSQQVATLEREVGMALLQRTNDGPLLTDAGESLLSHADAVIARLEEAERELGEIAGLAAGRLRIASFPSASATLVTRALSMFGARFPGVELKFSEFEPEESIPQLRRGEIDVAVVFDYPSLPPPEDRDVDRVKLLTESMHVALPHTHPLAERDAIRLEQLAEEPWLSGTRPSTCADLIVDACREAGFEPRIEFESDDYSVLQGFVAGGLGVTLLPDLALAALRPDVVVRDVVPHAPQRRVWAAVRAAGSRSPAAEAMLEDLARAGEQIADEVAGAGENGAATRRRQPSQPRTTNPKPAAKARRRRSANASSARAAS
jgi:DNA-binding transcriptional LysR family regulator